ncbi:MAG: toxin-antitoxin system YwqK family antitoxin [Reichenbachiella sp.]|uniref:toxin-antitoxin system YwqK family antitoxin n=1 Tax=Reichenbachiella sp. TaxID=2184521 RepID=UPI00326649BB
MKIDLTQIVFISHLTLNSMTRDEHLSFCKKCHNRKFNPDHGLVCTLTDQVADFDGSCEHFDHDESVIENIEVENKLTTQIVSELPDEIVEKYRAYQDISYAIIGGFFLSIVCAMLWAVFTVSTQYQIVYMAIGVGYLVGRGIRFFGAGIDPIFGFIGSFFAFLGCALGNLFSQVGFIAEAEYLGFIETLMLLDGDTIQAIYMESFNPMDILFYAMATFAGYKFAFRPIPNDVLKLADVRPEKVQLRLPLVLVCLAVIGLSWHSLSKGVSGRQQYYYEDGQTRSEGEYINGLEEGSWFYYHENGRLYLMAEYKNGIESDEWQWYYEDGTIMQIGHYNNGLFDQLWKSFYPNGVLADSSVYQNGRKHGISRNYFENGQVSQTGIYKRDRQQGLWTMYYENGVKSAEGNFVDGKPSGIWKVWDEKGNQIQELEHLTDEKLKLWKVWGKNNNQLVRDGNGTYKNYDNGGNLTQQGEVKNGDRTGDWISYFPDGSIKEEAIFKDNEFIIQNAWSESEQLIKDGEGNYVSYYPESGKEMEKGQLKEGKRHGNWQIFHPNSIVISQDLNYKNGKLDGKGTIYFANGLPQSEGAWKDGKRLGKWIWYYESGVKQCEINYENDKKQGAQIFWSELGREAKEEIYEDGELISERLL